MARTASYFFNAPGMSSQPWRANVPARSMASSRAGLGPDWATVSMGGDDAVGVERGDGLHGGLEHGLHAEWPATVLENVEQALPADAAEAVAAGGDGAALEVDVDVVPVVEGIDDAGVRLVIGLGEVAEGLAGKHHAPTEGVVRAVPLEHGDFVPGIALLHDKGEVQAPPAAP